MLLSWRVWVTQYIICLVQFIWETFLMSFIPRILNNKFVVCWSISLVFTSVFVIVIVVEQPMAVGWAFSRVKVFVTLQEALLFCITLFMKMKLNAFQVTGLHYSSSIWSWIQNHVNYISLHGLLLLGSTQFHIRVEPVFTSNYRVVTAARHILNWHINAVMFSIIANVFIKLLLLFIVFIVFSFHTSCFNILVNKTHLQFYFILRHSWNIWCAKWIWLICI